jgi:hypothetical protein
MKLLQIERSVSHTFYYIAHSLLRKPQSPPFVSPKTHEPGSATCAKRIAGLALSSLVSFLAQWTTLTIFGLIGLTDFCDGLFSWFTLKILIASALALVFCILALPFTLPWLILSLPVYFFVPGESVLRQWWVCTPLGVAAGVFAVWAEALLCSMFTPGNLFSVNAQLLLLASIPAGVTGGVLCLTASLVRDLLDEPNASKAY